MMAATKQQRVKRAISYYFTQLRHIKTLTTGNDLIKMGLEPGLLYREIFEAILDEKLNGHLNTTEDEIDFVKAYVS